MKFFLEKIRALGVGWNERQLTERDFHDLCRRHGIRVSELPMFTTGFYFHLEGGHHIAVDTTLPPKRKLMVMFHEFGHFLMHDPASQASVGFCGVGKKTRKEIEADIFALVALIPRGHLVSRSAADLADEGFEPQMIIDRISIFEKYGI